MKKRAIILLLILSSINLFAQTKLPIPKVIAGPMLGYAEHKECLVWIQTTCNKSVSIKYTEVGGNTEGEQTINNKNENGVSCVRRTLASSTCSRYLQVHVTS